MLDHLNARPELMLALLFGIAVLIVVVEWGLISRIFKRRDRPGNKSDSD